MYRTVLAHVSPYGPVSHDSARGISGEEAGDGQMKTTQTRSLKPGEPAPDFRLPSTRGTEVALSEFRGRKHVVLAFLRGMT